MCQIRTTSLNQNYDRGNHRVNKK